MNIAQGIEQLSIALLPMLLGIIFHEVAHGYVAYYLGDPTAKMEGRLTLNPAPHIDTTGAMVFIFSSLLTPFALGWAKPVPVDPRYFANMRKGMLWVALAGPFANLCLAIVFTILFKLFLWSDTILISERITLFLGKMLYMGVAINILLAVFNMLPIPPLDGSKMVAYFLPPVLAYKYESWERFGFIIILCLVMFGLTSIVIFPMVSIIIQLLFTIFSIQ